MERIARFEFVSKEQFVHDWIDTFGSTQEAAETVYQNLKKPKRATTGSAGYDFYAPLSITLAPGETIKIPTGIRARMAEGWVLTCDPRSGLGFKFRLQLNNTVGIIDSDYYHADNEGHIAVKFRLELKEAPDGPAAYSFSAGGPIIDPTASVFSVMPVCPHSLLSRAVLLAPENALTLSGRTRDAFTDIHVTMDGKNARMIPKEAEIHIRKSEYTAKIIKIGATRFYDILETKLNKK